MRPTRFAHAADSQRMRQMADTLHEALRRHGYQLVETPIIEAADLFLTKAGDQIVSRLFTFERHGQQLALRPEFTATAAHDYVLDHGHEGSIVRWQFNGPIFEDEPARARTRYQRFSIGAELIGMGEPLADAEVIAVAVDGARRLGIEGWQLVIGHVGLMRLLLARFNLDARTQRFLLSHLPALNERGKAYVLEALERLILGRVPADDTNLSLLIGPDGDAEFNTQQMLGVLLDATQRSATMGGRTRHDIVRRLMQKRQRASEYHQIVAAVDFLEQWGTIDAAPDAAFAMLRQQIAPEDAEARALLERWEAAIHLLPAWDVPLAQTRIRPDLARSWDYYTGMVFELYADGLHLAGGGRYDELIKLVGGERDVPAVGFVYYPDALLAAAPPATAPDQPAVTLVMDPQHAESGLRWAQALRNRNFAVSLYPSDDGLNGGVVLRASADGHVDYAGRRYAPGDLDQLIGSLSGAQQP